jgi:uncharacterized glyoxalase superfamily protein PhnB
MDTGLHSSVRVVDLNYFSLYVEQFDEAVAFYTRVFGPPGYTEGGGELYGWQMGATWLTLFPADGTDITGNPRNCEFAVQVARVDDVDALYEQLIASGARPCMRPKDTRMYQRMRFACVDDPFGVRLDIYCPL